MMMPRICAHVICALFVQTPKAVRKLTMHVDIKQNGAIVVSGVDWYWFTTGVTRAVRKGVAALSEDWRDTGTSPICFRL